VKFAEDRQQQEQQVGSVEFTLNGDSAEDREVDKLARRKPCDDRSDAMQHAVSIQARLCIVNRMGSFAS
jgi:hypothetical protein